MNGYDEGIIQKCPLLPLFPLAMVYGNLPSYYNLDLSFCLFVYYLLRRLWTDCDQTWQECQRQVNLASYDIGFHGNHTVSHISSAVYRPIATKLGRPRFALA